LPWDDKLLREVPVTSIMPTKITRRYFLKLSLLCSAGVIFLLSCVGLSKREKKVSYLSNPDLDTVKSDYPGNCFVNGRFVNLSRKADISFLKIIKWRFSSNPQQKEIDSDSYRLNVIRGNSFFDSNRDMIVWLGHASFLIRIDGVTFLTDPCLTNPVFVRRLSELPLDISSIKDVDYLLISHSHLDHLDSDSLEALDLKNTEALLPLGMKPLVRSVNRHVIIQEAGWYQKFNTPEGEPDVFMMPAQHWSNRSLWDQNEVLWGSYIIRGKKRCIYFAGDTAYSHHFRESAQLFPEIDICLMPVGAYKPDYIMKGSHVSPHEAVDAFRDLKGRVFVPMHYGTFTLSDEPPGEPLRILRHLESRDRIGGELRILDAGEVYNI